MAKRKMLRLDEVIAENATQHYFFLVDKITYFKYSTLTDTTRIYTVGGSPTGEMFTGNRMAEIMDAILDSDPADKEAE